MLSDVKVKMLMMLKKADSHLFEVSFIFEFVLLVLDRHPLACSERMSVYILRDRHRIFAREFVS